MAAKEYIRKRCGKQFTSVCTWRNPKYCSRVCFRGSFHIGSYRAHSSWRSMKRRCYAPNCPEYARYGAVGITMCDAWKDSFLAFLADMGERPEGLTIDRIDNTKGYYKENCRWATYTQQNRNRRFTRFLEIDGVTKPISEWAEVSPVPFQTIVDRVKRGWNPKDAVFLPRKYYKGCRNKKEQ